MLEQVGQRLDAYSVPLSTIWVRREMPSRFINSWANVTSRERLARSFRASSLASMLDDWIRSWSCWAFWASRERAGKNKGKIVQKGNHNSTKNNISMRNKDARSKAQDHMHTGEWASQGQVPTTETPPTVRLPFTSQWEPGAFFWYSLSFPFQGKAGQEHQDIKAAETKQWCGREEGESTNVYFVSKIVIWKWQKAICLVKQSDKCKGHAGPFYQGSE